MVPLPLLALVVAVLAADITLTWVFLLDGGPLDGLVLAPLVAMWKTAFLIAPIAFGLGRLAPRDVGLVPERIATGAGVTAAAWLGVQLVLLAGAMTSGEVTAATVVAGSVIAQVFGTGLMEEAIFRGLLFGQLRTRWSTTAAALASSLVFALWHIPQHLWLGYQGVEMVGAQVVVLTGGLIACGLYRATGNLFVVVGLHALFNEPAALIESPVPAQVALGAVVAAGVGAAALRARAR